MDVLRENTVIEEEPAIEYEADIYGKEVEDANNNNEPARDNAEQ